MLDIIVFVRVRWRKARSSFISRGSSFDGQPQEE